MGVGFETHFGDSLTWTYEEDEEINLVTETSTDSSLTFTLGDPDNGARSPAAPSPPSYTHTHTHTHTHTSFPTHVTQLCPCPCVAIGACLQPWLAVCAWDPALFDACGALLLPGARAPFRDQATTLSSRSTWIRTMEPPCSAWTAAPPRASGRPEPPTRRCPPSRGST